MAGTALFLRAVFRRVDLAQAKVVPEQVRGTLDTLAEGVLVLDRRGVIGLANEAFARTVGATPEALRGKRASDLPWHAGAIALRPEDRPWARVLRDAAPQMGRVLGLGGGAGGKTLSVNSTPIFGDDGTCRGALATFDDLTAVERAKPAGSRRSTGSAWASSADGPRAQAAAHTNKGMVGFFGADVAVIAARRLEQAAGGRAWAGPRATFENLARELEALGAALTPYGPGASVRSEATAPV